MSHPDSKGVNYSSSSLVLYYRIGSVNYNPARIVKEIATKISK